jgi:hypothetical protein
MVAIATPGSDESVAACPPDLRLVQPRRRQPSARVVCRRRQVAGALLILVALFAAYAVGIVGADTSRLGRGSRPAPQPDGQVLTSTRHAGQIVYVVEPGDTVWSIARRLQGRGEIRPLVDRLVAQEHGRTLQPGDRLVLP